jgi:hypothetical protein
MRALLNFKVWRGDYLVLFFLNYYSNNFRQFKKKSKKPITHRERKKRSDIAFSPTKTNKFGEKRG